MDEEYKVDLHPEDVQFMKLIAYNSLPAGITWHLNRQTAMTLALLWSLSYVWKDPNSDCLKLSYDGQDYLRRWIASHK